MPPKKEKKTGAKIKQKQKQTQKQVVNVNINNEIKSKRKGRRKELSSSEKVQNVAKNLRGNPTNDMVYRQARSVRPINHNIVPELPISGNQLMSEMRQIMQTHIKPSERTPLQMTQAIRESMMQKADGIVKNQNSMGTQTEYPKFDTKEELDAAEKIKANIRQKISTDAVESIIEKEIDNVLSRPRTRSMTTSESTTTVPPAPTPTRSRGSRTNVRFASNAELPNVTLAEYRAMFPDGANPPMTGRGYLRRGTLKYRAYINHSSQKPGS